MNESAPLIVAANRDEAFERPARPAAHWDDCPGVIAGRDLAAGGTWMGVAQGGRWSAVTNIRKPEWMTREMPRSRGSLVAGYLCGDRSPGDYARTVGRERAHYGGFNLVLGDRESLYYASREEPHPALLAPGIYGLSNGRLDDPWPKIARGGRAFREWIGSELNPEDGLALLRDSESAPDELLPDTGVGIELERVLSPLFIVGEAYGTRSSTLLILRGDGSGTHVERSYGPGGDVRGTIEHEIDAIDSARTGGVERGAS